MCHIYHRCMPYGYPRNRITRRDNISRVKSPRVQSERVRIERRRYTWAAFPSRSRTRSRFIVVYVVEPGRINAASLSSSNPPESFSAAEVLYSSRPSAFFSVCCECVRSPCNDLTSLRKRFCDNGRRTVVCNTGCQLLATGNTTATNVRY